jgi:hypothetical protein
MDGKHIDAISQTLGRHGFSRRTAVRLLLVALGTGSAGVARAGGVGAHGRRGLPAGRTCDPARPQQCRSGICGCNGDPAEGLCICRTRTCKPPGGGCRRDGNPGCCQGVCQFPASVCSNG